MVKSLWIAETASKIDGTPGENTDLKKLVWNKLFIDRAELAAAVERQQLEMDKMTQRQTAEVSRAEHQYR